MPASSPRSTTPVAPTPRPEVRQAVKTMLTQSKAFASLPPAKQQEVARDTALVADYLASPEGIRGDTIPGGIGSPAQARALFVPDERAPGSPASQETYTDARKAVSEIGDKKFQASAAREGANVAGLLLKKVNFVDFVSGLIQGVFSSIVTSSIQQMQAYATMVEQVAKSLQQFRDDNVNDQQGREQMVERFPDLFEVGQDDFAETPGARLKLRDGVDEGAALQRVRTSMKFEDGKLDSMDLSDDNVQQALVTAARTQLARQRQQLLASLVILGINRIVVTDGKITAKIMYDFQARDSRSMRRSAMASDFARTKDGEVAVTHAGEKEWDEGADTSYSRDKDGAVDRDGNYFAKGKHKYSEQPVMTAMSTASEASDSQLQTRAQLAGAVEVNFKSDYLPLEKMATPGMIAAIQGNSTPVDPNVVPSARNPQPAAGSPPAPAAAATPAAG